MYLLEEHMLYDAGLERFLKDTSTKYPRQNYEVGLHLTKNFSCSKDTIKKIKIHAKYWLKKKKKFQTTNSW